MAKATGQFTIVDYNDALTLTTFISSNQVKTQLYNPDNSSFTPDWSVSPFLVLTASLYKIGDTTDLLSPATQQEQTNSNVKSVTYYEVLNGVKTQISGTATRVFSGFKNKILTIKSNEMASLSAKDYICEVTYTDPNTELDLTVESSISFSKIQNGSGLVDAIANTPNGNIFKNSEVASLDAVCNLWRGSTIDSTNVTYQWYIQDPTVQTDQGGGIGWRKLTTDTTKWINFTTDTLTIYPPAFTNIGVFKCGVKDNDSASPTYNTTFWDTVTFIDNTDPLVITITSTGGNIFKNGQGSTTLSALVYQAGYEVDASGTTYTYKWYKYDKDGNLVDNFGGTGVSYRTGKTLALTYQDVDVKATFKAEID